MVITNDTNLPSCFVRAMEAGDREPKLISPSKMCDSVRQILLSMRHHHEAVRDASSMLWSMFGTALHGVVEKHADGMTEHHMETMIDVDGIPEKFAGTLDVYEDGVITDFKTTSAWTIVYGSRLHEWTVQLNSYRYLLEQEFEGDVVEKMEIKALLKDWSKSKALDGGDYPQKPVVTVPIKEIDVLPIFENKVRLLRMFADTEDDKLPPCTDVERWKNPSVWKVMIKDRKRAVKVCKSRDEAQAYMNYNLKNGMGIFEFPAKANRCPEYCDGKDFCNQYQEELNEQG